MKDKNKLFQSFSSPTGEDWEKVTGSELAEGMTLDSFKWKTEDRQTFEPLYTQLHTENLQYLHHFRLAHPSHRLWKNMPEVIVADETRANAEALDHLIHEAEGVVFRLENKAIDFEKLFKGIEWQHCSICFLVHHGLQIDSLFSYIDHQALDRQKISGAVFSQSHALPSGVLDDTTSLKLLGIAIESSTPAQEIAHALVRGVKLIESYSGGGNFMRALFNNICFKVTIGSNLLLEVCKLKALRILWYQIAQAYNVSNFQPSHLYIHGVSDAWVNESFQPQGNMIKSTVSAIAAIAGGCDGITIQPEDPHNVVMRRIARNVSPILLEESHLGKVRDPFAGAYSIDVITDQIAKDAWGEFQKRI